MPSTDERHDLVHRIAFGVLGGDAVEGDLRVGREFALARQNKRDGDDADAGQLAALADQAVARGNDQAAVAEQASDGASSMIRSGPGAMRTISPL